MTKRKEMPVSIDDMENLNYNIYIIAFIVVIISTLIYFLYSRTKTVRRNILLMGLSDSGKTVIYSQLLHSKHISTYTSIKENSGEYTVNNKSVKVVDIPGDERLRGKFFDQYKSGAKGIVYVIDSLTMQKEVRDVAEYLYQILTDPVLYSNGSKVLILCNKQDETLAKGSSVIKTLLEKEMNTLRITQTSRLTSVDNTKQKEIHLGNPDKDFDFSNISPYSVTFAESHVQNDDTNVEDIENWLSKVA